MKPELKGLTAVVTGGTRGIGLAVVRRLLRDGCRVITCARKPAAHAVIEAHYQAALQIDTVDVTSPSATQWIQSLGPFDILVLNVSAMSADWEASIQTDIRSTVALAEASIPVLTQSGSGAITYIGSKAATQAMPGFDAYGAAKAAMIHYMKSLSLRHPAKLRVNVLSPGDCDIEGGFWDRVKEQFPQRYVSALRDNPQGKFSTPEQIADAVVFLSSPRAGAINGAHLLADGGSTRHVQGS